MTKPNDPAPPKQITGALSAPALSSRELFGDGREVIILHGSERYRLVVTRSDKLILIK